jgi:hypothetical protein
MNPLILQPETNASPTGKNSPINQPKEFPQFPNQKNSSQFPNRKENPNSLTGKNFPNSTTGKNPLNSPIGKFQSQLQFPNRKD